MKVRITAALLAVVAVLGLSACQTKAGAAALVGGQRITESTVNGYLTPTASPFQAQGGGQIVPRSFVLQTLVRDQVFSAALAANGIAVTTSDLASAKEAVLQGSSEDDIIKQLGQSGFQPSFEPVLVHESSLQQIFVSKIGAKSDADVLAAIDKAHLSITVNPRFGTWDAKTLSLGAIQPPSFLQLDSSLVPST